MEMLSGPMKLMMSLMGGNGKPKAGCEIKTQYCTAIPIGTALAQSFDTDFVQQCGDIVGEEMEHFGVHLWLAPAGATLSTTLRIRSSPARWPPP